MYELVLFSMLFKQLNYISKYIKYWFLFGVSVQILASFVTVKENGGYWKKPRNKAAAMP